MPPELARGHVLDLAPREESVYAFAQPGFRELADPRRVRFVHDRRTSSGEISFTPAALKLLQAGRDPFTEPGFLVAWASGDAAAVRAWVRAAAEAISLQEQ